MQSRFFLMLFLHMLFNEVLHGWAIFFGICFLGILKSDIIVGLNNIRLMKIHTNKHKHCHNTACPDIFASRAYTAFSPVCIKVLIFLESVEREERVGRGGEEEENLANQAYHVLKP